MQLKILTQGAIYIEYNYFMKKYDEAENFLNEIQYLEEWFVLSLTIWEILRL